MYNGKLIKYYDDLYNKKNYYNESKFIENNSKLDKVLDVGCGTGTHLEKLYKDGRIFYGIDVSKEIIKIANDKFRNYPLCYFKNCHVDEFKEISNFNTIISMFNVINHILTLEDLELYFKSISSLLSKDGTFIFDCFNGSAVHKDIPKNNIKEVVSKAAGGTYLISCKSKFNSMTSNLKMENNVRVIYLDEIVDEFDYNLEHTIWSPIILSSLSKKYNMNVEKVVSNSDYDKEATSKDYKITFICKKENK